MINRLDHLVQIKFVDRKFLIEPPLVTLGNLIQIWLRVGSIVRA